MKRLKDLSVFAVTFALLITVVILSFAVLIGLFVTGVMIIVSLVSIHVGTVTIKTSINYIKSLSKK